MKIDTERWIYFAEDNLAAAKILLSNNLTNPCLQNTQQAVEKALKAVFVEKRMKYSTTHDILALKYMLKNNKIEILISDNDCETINSIYLPSLYPASDILVGYHPDNEKCLGSIKIAENVIANIKQYLAEG